jgi:hypothetical protein
MASAKLQSIRSLPIYRANNGQHASRESVGGLGNRRRLRDSVFSTQEIGAEEEELLISRTRKSRVRQYWR